MKPDQDGDMTAYHTAEALLGCDCRNCVARRNGELKRGDGMPRPAVEALVKVMLGPIQDQMGRIERSLNGFPHNFVQAAELNSRVGPIEDRLAAVEGRLNLRDIEAKIKFCPESVTVLKSELERLRRIEKALRRVVLLWDVEASGHIAWSEAKDEAREALK